MTESVRADHVLRDHMSQPNVARARATATRLDFNHHHACRTRGGECILWQRYTYAHALQFTVTMFLIDVSKSMGKKRQIELPGQNPNDEPYHKEITNLEWGLQFVKLKIQEMVGNVSSDVPCSYCLADIQWPENRQMRCDHLWLRR